MAHKNLVYIPSEDFYLQPIYSCIHCRANLAHHRDLISKSFQGSQGRAYLFNNVVNVGSLVAEERMLLTGLHYVADIYCECCSFILGWKYERAFEPNQRYKEGKYIIELANLIKDNCWDIECNKLKLRMHPPKIPQLFGTDWNMSNDSLLSTTKVHNNTYSSVIRSNDDKLITKLQSKSTFIRELSRDFQQLFGITEKNNIVCNSNNDKDEDTGSCPDLVVMNDEISNSTMSTSIEKQGDSFIRMNSDNDNVDSFNEYVTHSITVNSSDQKSIETQNDLMNSYNGSTDNNSLNTSFNSSKGLLEASCSSDRKLLDSKTGITTTTTMIITSNFINNNNTKIFSKPTVCNSITSHQIKPLSDASLSVSNGTSSKTHSKNHGRSRHKCRSRHPSNVVNPQKINCHTKNKSASPGEVLSVSTSNFQAPQNEQNM